MLPQHLTTLIDVLKKLPGVGTKSAERFAFHLLNWDKDHLNTLARVIQEIPIKLKHCPTCGCLQGEVDCSFCSETRAKSQSLCIVAYPRDVFAVESTREFQGLYHVLGGLLSPLDGITPEKLSFPLLKQRIEQHQIKEIIVALDATVEGDATALYIKQEFSSLATNLSRLAFGLPMGSTFDYVDGGTLARAFVGRGHY